jgi:AcrR family transcriptional regulator
LLAAARRVFLAKGYAGATLEAIAEEAGFSKGVVYSQFGGKADMFLALLEQRIEERVKQNESATKWLKGERGIRALLQLAAREGAAAADWARLLVEFRALAARDPLLNRRYAEAHERTVQGLAAVLERIYELGEVEPVAPLESLAEFVLAVGSGLTLERAVNVDALPEGDLTELVVRALGFGDGAGPASS